MPAGHSYDATPSPKKIGLNREYACVRQLIGVLTNDYSDKLIVEKLKGKDLSELLCSSKILGKSKDIATNKRILDCVIRAIEREKQLLRRKEIETSWSRRFLSSFNCLYPIKSDVSVLKENGVNRSKKRVQGGGKNTSSKGGAKSVKNGGKVRTKRNAALIYPAQLRGEGMVKFGNILNQSSKPGKCLHIFKNVLPSYETVVPPNLSLKQAKHLEYVPQTSGELDTLFLDRITSSTQTWDLDSLYPQSKTQDTTVINKLHHLLEAANYQSDDQSLSIQNFIRYDDLSMSTKMSPYLKYPLKSTKGMNDPDSFHDKARSELSLESEGSGYELIGLGERESKESNSSTEGKACEALIKPKLHKKEHDIRVYESLKNPPEDHRKIGACLMKRINASIKGCKTDDSCSITNTIVPELVLKCTELFENETDDEEFNDSVDCSSCITSLEVRSVNREPSFSQRSYQNNNYCFSTKKNSVSSEPGLLGVSDNSMSGVMLYGKDSGSSNGRNYSKINQPDRKIVKSEAPSENATQTPAMSVNNFLEGLRDKLSQSMQNSGQIIVKKDQVHSSIEINRTRECLDMKTKNLEIQKTVLGLSAEIWTNQLSNEREESSPSTKNSLGPTEFENELNSIAEEQNSLVARKSDQKINLSNEIIFENHVPTSATSFSFIEGSNDHRAIMRKKGKRKTEKRSKKKGLNGTKSCKVM